MNRNLRNKLPLPVLAAEKKAGEILTRFGIDGPEHIRVKDLAYALGAGVIEGPLRGAAARLTRSKNGAVIRISDREIYDGRKRFSIAHELGHLVLDHGKNKDVVCSDKDMIAALNDASKESEANAFAGELLLPTALVNKSCDVAEVTFDPVRSIAERFRTSLTATALKFVRLCPEMCAVVYCQDGEVKWIAKSNEFWPFIPMTKKLDRRTLAYDYFKVGELREDPEEVDADAWLDIEKSRGVDEVVEHSIAMPRLGSVLSMIWIRCDTA
jgi:hypothetical protein